MEKLYFRYGAMNCGKSSALMLTAHNYEEHGLKPLVIKSVRDTKAGDKLSSRVGLERKVDILIGSDESFIKYYPEFVTADCLLVDEAQFLSSDQVEELWYVAKILDTPVICYGLRTDFQTKSFDGSRRLFELADELEELTTICACGKKARFNSRFVNGEFTLDGDSIVIDKSVDNVEYIPMCGECYLKHKMKLENKEKVRKRII